MPGCPAAALRGCGAGPSAGRRGMAAGSGSGSGFGSSSGFGSELRARPRRGLAAPRLLGERLGVGREDGERSRDLKQRGRPESDKQNKTKRKGELL